MNGFPPPSVVDVIALGFIVLGALQGFLRGLSGELAALIGTVAALALSVRYYRPFGGWVLAHSRLEGRPAFALAFLVVVIAAVLIMLLLRFGLKRIMKVVVEPGADRLGGLLAGTIRATVIVVIVFVTLNLFPNDYLNRVFGEESLTGTAVVRATPHAREIINNVLHLDGGDSGGDDGD